MATTAIKYTVGALTELDKAARDAEIATLVAEGVTDGSSVIENGYRIRPWTTAEAADNWVTYANTAFVAKPIDVIVTS
jgi:hypothetical protein